MGKTTKRTHKGQFKKGWKGGPGRPRKDKGKPEEPVTPETIRERFFSTFLKLFTEKEMLEFCQKSQLNKRLFISEIRRLLPTLMAVQSKVETDFKPLRLIVSKTSADEHITNMESNIHTLTRELRESNEKINKLIDFIVSHGIKPPSLEHTPIAPLSLTEGSDGEFRSDAERKLEDEEDDDKEPGGSSRVN